jgi:cbb3-type cytochrome oxidase maturation protein
VDVLLITVFVSLLLVVGGLVLFFVRLRAGDFDHGDRLSLLPLADDPAGAPVPEANPQEP